MSRVVVLGYRAGIDEALVRRQADTFYVVDPRSDPAATPFDRVVERLEDAQEVLRAVLASDLGEVSAVVTHQEEGVYSAAVLRHHFGLSSRDPAGMLLFRDKFLQKQALPSSVRHAACRYLSTDLSYSDVADDLGPTFVVKPSNGCRSDRTRIVSSSSEFVTYLAAPSRGPTRRSSSRRTSRVRSSTSTVSGSTARSAGRRSADS